MEENSTEGNIEILIKKLNKELDFLIENANKTEQLTATSIIAMKEPIILLFLSVLSNHKRILKVNEELKETYKSEKKMKNEYLLEVEHLKLYQDLLLKENVISIQKIIAKEVVDILKQILQELLESEETNDKNNKKG